MSDEPDTSGKMKVVDRRRFTAEGEVRPDWKPSPPAPSAGAGDRGTPPAREPGGPSEQRVRETGAAGVKGGEGPAPRSEPPAGASLFLELVATLAQQAELLLVGAPGLPKEPQQAKRLIDYLGVLEVKTEGNLTAEEKQILSNAVFQLRTLYVQSSR